MNKVYAQAGELLSQTPLQTCKLRNGETLSYREFNKGKDTNKHTIVLMPGYTLEAGMTAAMHLVDLPNAWNDHYVIAVNPRGFAESTMNESIYRSEDFADDIKLFLDQLGVKQTMVWGHSASGCTACWLALKYPETITAAFLTGSASLDGFQTGETMDGKPVQSRQDLERLVQFIEELGPQSESIEKFKSCWLSFASNDKWPTEEDIIFQAWHKSATQTKARARAHEATLWFNVTPIACEGRFGPTFVLKDLKVPLIVIHGPKDKFADVNQVRSVIQLTKTLGWAPKGLVSYYEHSEGHFPFFECLDEYLALYRQALNEQVLHKDVATTKDEE